MQLIRFIVGAITLGCGGAFLGCSGASPFSGQPMDAFSTAQGFDAPNRQPYGQLARAFPEHNVVGPSGSMMPAQPPRESSGSGWLASLRSTGDAMADALTIKPQTIPAPDPTSLANRPGDVGGALNYHAAKVYESEGNIAGAMALYQKSLQMTPNDVRAMIGYGRLLDRTGNFREAERLYQQSLELEPTNVVALNDLGMIYARQGMFDSALDALSQAVQLQPSNLRYRNNIAIVLIDVGKPDQALGHLIAVHGEATAHYNLAFLLSRRNMNDQAIGHLQQALSKNPNLTPARQLLVSLTPAIDHSQQTAPQPSNNNSGIPVSGGLTNPHFVPYTAPSSPPRPLPPL
ncbi:MAG: tetratricopeptide repeat protein [Planctomycetaceae bacterium]|nr:tetratricopeptide repeat protein [Planctomycetales bacterium]MCB9923353.1 tetratricopeptide repeat protein [Planctomycetaceae bacterium]